jgi:peptide/nickel transport system permease protein
MRAVRALRRALGAAVTVVAVPTLSFLFWTVQIEQGQWDFVHVRGPSLLERVRAYVSATFVHFDLGRSDSLAANPVARVIEHGLPYDLALLAASLAVGVAVAMAATARAAALVSALAALALSAPVYTLALGVLLLFSPDSGRFPVGFVSGQAGATGGGALQWLHALWVPALILALPVAAAAARVMHASGREVAGEEYVRTAVATGLPPRAVRRQVTRAAAAPAVSLLGASMGVLVLNLALVEEVFNVPGSFRGVRDAVSHLDLPLLQGMVLVTTVLVVAGNLVADAVVALLRGR